MKQQKRLIVLGAGKSGLGAAQLAQLVGYDVFVSDKSPIKPAIEASLQQLGIAYEQGQHSMGRILDADEVVKSPGIPEKSEVMQALRAKGTPVIGEIEFAFRFAGPCRIVGITGSNGKTTTTQLVQHLLLSAGLNAHMGGNVGISFAEIVADQIKNDALDPDRIFVLEISSFQLDDILTFRPDIAILLNITPDHLDRYGYEMSNYVQSKFRIAMNQEAGDLLVTNGDDPEISAFMEQHPETIRGDKELVHFADLLHGYVHIGDEMAFDLSGSNLKGPHNLFNAACAIRAALRLDIEPEIIAEGLYSFSPPPHRLEKVAVVKGVTYINDSKATNVDAVYYALQAMDRPTVWIVGGQDKGNDYSPLLPLVERMVKAIVCLGLDNSKLYTVFEGLGKPMCECKSAEAAVEAASEWAVEGENVLLSPACASFDLFNNYEHRGDLFRAAVINLKNK